MRQKTDIFVIFKTILNIPVMVVLAIIGAIFVMVKKGEKDCKGGAKISKKRIEILLKKNPMLISNIKKFTIGIKKSLEKCYPDINKYISNTFSSASDIYSFDETKDGIKLNIYIIDISTDLILKDLTGFTNIEEFKKSVIEGYESGDGLLMDYEDDNEKVKQLVDNTFKVRDNINESIKFVNECLKDQYKGIIKIKNGDDDSFYIDDFYYYGFGSIELHINGNINNFDLSEEFKNKVKSLTAKIKL